MKKRERSECEDKNIKYWEDSTTCTKARREREKEKTLTASWKETVDYTIQQSSLMSLVQ